MATKRNQPRVQRLPARDAVPASDRWDLKSLFRSDAAWQRAMAKWERQIAGYDRYRGQLGRSAATLAAGLQFDSELDRAAERLAYYAHLKTAEDSANAHYQGMMARFLNVASRAEEAASFLRPEILAIPSARLKKFLAQKVMAPWRLAVERLVRFQPYTLSQSEERLLAMQSEMAQVSHHAFEQLHNSDMRFGVVRDE
ncbi:MAG: oligoendopeptidase F, partial [Planctomycetales bacterium]|nr:oligoendopeptidase F [Planctomycetales bacterium]